MSQFQLNKIYIDQQNGKITPVKIYIAIFIETSHYMGYDWFANDTQQNTTLKD